LLLSVLLDFGIGNYTTSNLAKNPNLLEKQFSALLTIKIFFSALYIVTTLILAAILNYDKSIWFLIFMLSFNQVLSFFHIYFRSNVSGLQLFKTDSIFSVLDRLLMIIFCSILLFTNIFELNITNFVYAQTLAYGISAAISFTFISKKISKITLIFDKVNEYREENCLYPLKWSKPAHAVALNQAEYCSRVKYVYHDQVDSTVNDSSFQIEPDFRKRFTRCGIFKPATGWVFAENLMVDVDTAYNQSIDQIASETIAGWKSSPSHNSMMLMDNLEFASIAHVISDCYIKNVFDFDTMIEYQITVTGKAYYIALDAYQ
jgi:hypothetical protein